MPNMNGYEATCLIRGLPDERKARLPILAMTANAFEADKREAYRCGMNGHIAKPINVRELMQEICEKYPNKTIWLYTGAVWETLYNDPMMRYVDVLVDGEFEVDKKDTKLLWKGSSNQRVIDVKRTLESETPEIPILHCTDYGK